jgi:trimethylamine--corrinoid protein Co-methyltransferase
MSGLVPADVPTARANTLQMKAMIQNSIKPIMFVTNDYEGSISNVEAAEAVIGGEKQLEKKPYVCCYINVTDPFRHNRESLQKVLFLSGKGVPTTYTPMVLRGINGPVTSAGATALANAGELVGLVLAQLNRKGAPVLLSGGYGDIFDMRTMTDIYTGPESYGTRPSMASYYGLPIFGLGGASDAKIPDEQSAIEASLTLHFEALCGVNMVHDVGYLESGKTFSLEQLVICDEIIGYIRRFSQGIEVSDETLAVELTKQQGHHGEYLGTEHTVTHYKKDWRPTLFDRNNYEGWKSAGATTMRERAKAKVDDALGTHRPVQLPSTVREESERILGNPSSDGK